MSNKQMKLKVLNHYGKICSWCKEDDTESLEMDHIDNSGNCDRRKSWRFKTIYRFLIDNNYPKSFQVLCANCNFSKSLNGGILLEERKDKYKFFGGNNG